MIPRSAGTFRIRCGARIHFANAHTLARQTLNYTQTLGISISFRKTSNYELFIIYGFMCGKFGHFPRLPARM